MTYQAKFPLIKVQFSRRLRELRTTYGLKRGEPLSQQEIADMLGVSRRVYIDWENPTKINSVPSDINKWIALCEILETDLVFLATGLFDGQKERKHQDNYVNVYSRYTSDPDFHFIINVIMRWDSKLIRTMADHYEAITDHYEGQPPIE